MISESFVVNFLSSLAQSNSKLTLASAKERLQDIWIAEEIEFLDAGGRTIHGQKQLKNLLHERFRLRAMFEIECNREHSPDEQPDLGNAEEDAAEDSLQDDLSVSVAGGSPQQSVDPVLERVISTLDVQERRRDFVWAGFVVKDLLPGLGLESHEAQRWFDRLVDDQIFVLDKRPNPNNPDFPSTSVKLNRDNDTVKRVLNKNGRPSSGFQPVAMRGEPASATLIRERR